MPVRPSQPATYPGGRTLIEVIGTGDRVADPVAITIVDQTSGADKARHLDPRTPDTPWKSAVFWFPPTGVRREDGRLFFDLEHGISFHLRPNVPYVLRLQAVDGGVVEERLVWRAFRGKSSPPDWQPPPDAAWPVDEVKEPDAPAPVEVIASPPVEEEPRPVDPIIVPPPVEIAVPTKPTPKPGVPGWLYGLLAVLLVAGGGGAAWWLWPTPPVVAETPAPPPPPAPGPTGLADARRLVQEQMPADAAFAEGKRFLDAASLDGAFLLFRHAAEKGSTPAALAVGAMYDPALHSAKTSPLPSPNASMAASWYRKAAEAGDAEAQFRLGRVLMSGATDDPQGAEKAVSWLEKAAAQGHEQARAALPK